MGKTLHHIKLSICMPTHNRAEFMRETLESVISQADERVEIVVVDGASTDHTAQIALEYQAKFKNLIYYRCQENSGVDRDMAKAIELSRGEYCWMLSDDDWLAPGAIERALKEIESGCEIYLCNVMVCDFHMQPIRKRHWFPQNIKDRIFNLHEKDDFIGYCNAAQSICALFSYMSSIILRRQQWIEAGYDYDFDKSAYALAASLLSFLSRRCRVKYVRSPLVLWRCDNVSFSNEGGLVKRFLLDFDGYLRLADKYLGHDVDMKRAFLRVMTREHPWYTIIHVASFMDNPIQKNEFKNKMFVFGYGRRMTEVCFVLARLKIFVRMAVNVKRKIIRNRKLAKMIETLFS